MVGAKGTPIASIRIRSQQKQLESFCFCIALAVNSVDQLWQFTLPVIVPYGVVLGASLKTIALFASARGLGGILSNLWMPWYADGSKSAGKPRRRLAVLVSLVGCTIGYSIQGSASSFRPGLEASHVFIIGRFVTGFFSGMGPVLNAYITEISQGNDEVLRDRFKYLQMTNSMLGLVLAPLAGALAALGLEVPFYVATSLGVITLIVAYAFFKESSEILGGSTPVSVVVSSKDSRSSPAKGKAEAEGNPYCGAVTWLVALASACIVLIIAGYEVLMPTLIAQPSFGIQGTTAAIKQQHVAATVGLLGMPFSIAMMMSTILLFMPLTKRFGDISTTLIGAALMGLGCASIRFISHDLCMLALVNLFNGLCSGSFIPGLLPMFARYVERMFPTQQAIAQGVPSAAGQVAVVFSQNIIAAVISDFGIQAGSLYLGMCVVAYSILFSLACVIAQWSEPAKLNENQESLLGSEDPEKHAASAPGKDTTNTPTLLSGTKTEKLLKET